MNKRNYGKRVFALMISVLLVSLFLFPAFAVEGYEKAINSVVRIYVESTITQYANNIRADQRTVYSTGTGFAVGEKGKPVDTFVTNKHVVEETEESLRAYLVQNGLEDYSIDPGVYNIDGKRLVIKYQLNTVYYVLFEDLDTKKQASRVEMSPKYDLAYVLLPNPTTERQACEIALYEALPRGEKVWALGYPGLSDNAISIDMTDSVPSSLQYCTVSDGMVQFISNTTTFGNAIQHTANINHGNSGGPLVNAKGQVVGINTWGFSDGSGNSYISQTTQQLKQFLDQFNVKTTYIQLGKSLMPMILIVGGVAILAILVVVFVISKKKKKISGRTPTPAKGTETRKLVVTSGTLQQNKEFRLVTGTPYKIGTDSSYCTIVYPAQTPGVSRVHCEIVFDGTKVTVKDKNSTYGTFVNQKKLPANGSEILHRGQTLSIGSRKETFVLR